MDRRFFLMTGFAAGVVAASRTQAAPETSSVLAAPGEALCLMKLDEITTEATGFTRYEHHHQLSIPVSALIHPPAGGFKIRCSPLDQGSLDEKAFSEFINETKLNGDALRHHSHEVSFTADQLNRIALGEKDVKIAVLSPKGNPAHNFFFTAPRSAIIKVQRGRAKA